MADSDEEKDAGADEKKRRAAALKMAQNVAKRSKKDVDVEKLADTFYKNMIK